jgi:hypothetical protein
MSFRQNASLRRKLLLALCMFVGLWLSCCNAGRQDLPLSFLHNGTTTKDEVRTRIDNSAGWFVKIDDEYSYLPTVWGDGSIWTYRVDKETEGFSVSPFKNRWQARYSLVLEFDRNGVLRRHAFIDVFEKPQP